MENQLSCINWNERLKNLKETNVALYGAGKYGKHALENIKKYLPQLNVLFFLDDNKVRNDKKVDGIEIYSLSEALKERTDFSILITNYYINSVLKKIESCNYDVNKVFFWSELLIKDIEKEVLNDNRNKLERVYNDLSDYQSKMIYKKIIEARFTKKIDFLSQTCQTNQYFPEDIFSLSENEVFVDAGAFDGDTIRQFLKITKQKYKYIYAFEPDESNLKKMKKNHYDENIIVYNAGLYDKTAQIGFSANKGGSSTVEIENSNKIQTYKFDELELPDHKITFVKMDIEGSELKALKGMKETIKKYKPKLAICIYHKFEDLWELPMYIKELVPEYRLYMRNYTTYLDEIVLYAVL